MNRDIKKAIMKRSKLRNNFKKTKLSSDWDDYRKQRNYVVNLNKRLRTTYFNKAVTSQTQKRFGQSVNLFSQITAKSKNLLFLVMVTL